MNPGGWNEGLWEAGKADSDPYTTVMLIAGFALAFLAMAKDRCEMSIKSALAFIVIGFIASGLLMLASFPFFMIYLYFSKQ